MLRPKGSWRFSDTGPIRANPAENRAEGVCSRGVTLTVDVVYALA